MKIPIHLYTAAIGLALVTGSSAAVRNLAPLGTATASTENPLATADKANDANRNGNSVNGSIFSSGGLAGPGEFWEVDLGANYFLDSILLFPRVDVKNGSVRDFTIEVFDSLDDLVYTGDFVPNATTNDTPWGTSGVAGVEGQRVRLTLKDPNVNAAPTLLEFAELEVWGDNVAVPVNIASAATLTSTPGGFTATAANGIDGDLASSFAANSEPDGPMYHSDANAGQAFYRLDYSQDMEFNEVQIYNRVAPTAAGLAPQTTSGYRVSILNANGDLVSFLPVVTTGLNYDHRLDFGGAVGRTVLVEETVEGEFLAFAELRVFGDTYNAASPTTTNLALLGTASSTTSRTDCTPSDGNDGSREGRYGYGSVFHSVGPQAGAPGSPGTGAGEYWEVDLGAEYFLDRVLLFPRVDAQQNSVRDFKIEIFDAADELVWSADYLAESTTADEPWGSAQMSGVKGQRVRMTLDDPNFFPGPTLFTFAELEVWGSSAPVPVNIAPNATLTSSAPGFTSTIDNGVDGDLGASFDARSDADGPMFHDDPAAGQGFFRLDFGEDTLFDEVQLYNRVTNNLVATTTNYRVSVLDGTGATVASQIVDAAPRNYDHILHFSGVTGQAILLEEQFPGQFLAFSEIRVMAPAPPVVVGDIKITSITQNDTTGELTIQATLEADVLYFFERSSNLVNWIDIEEDFSTPTGNAEVMYTPPSGTPAQYYRFRKVN